MFMFFFFMVRSYLCNPMGSRPLFETALETLRLFSVIWKARNTRSDIVRDILWKTVWCHYQRWNSALAFTSAPHHKRISSFRWKGCGFPEHVFFMSWSFSFSSTFEKLKRMHGGHFLWTDNLIHWRFEPRETQTSDGDRKPPRPSRAMMPNRSSSTAAYRTTGKMW